MLTWAEHAVESAEVIRLQNEAAKDSVTVDCDDALADPIHEDDHMFEKKDTSKFASAPAATTAPAASASRRRGEKAGTLQPASAQLAKRPYTRRRLPSGSPPAASGGPGGGRGQGGGAVKPREITVDLGCPETIDNEYILLGFSLKAKIAGVSSHVLFKYFNN